MIVTYEAIDQSGRQVSDTMEASSVRAAMDALRQRQMFVTHIASAAEKTARSASTTASMADRPVRLSVKQLLMFTRQTAMLLNAGSAIVPALNSIARQFTKPRQKGMVRDIVEDLEEGMPLADALRKHQRTFDPTYCAIVAAGEVSATLSASFDRLTQMVGRRHAVQRRLINAMVYPALLTVMCTAIILVLLLFVLPRFQDMFATLGVPLPRMTAILLETSTLVRNYWPACLGGAALMGGGAAYLVLSDWGRTWLSNAITVVPLARQVATGLRQGQTCRVLGTLIESRVGVLESIDLLRGITINAQYQQLYDAMESQVSSGEPLSRPLEESGLFAPYICQAVRTGEESGRTGEALTYVADILDEDNVEMINTLTRLIEPLILIIMGMVVGLVAMSLFVPMFDVTSAVG